MQNIRPRSLGPHAFAPRIVERLEGQRCLDRFAGDDELIAAGAGPGLRHAAGIADITEADRLADSVALDAARQVAGDLAVAEDGFAAEKNNVLARSSKGREQLVLRLAGGGFKGG